MKIRHSKVMDTKHNLEEKENSSIGLIVIW